MKNNGKRLLFLFILLGWIGISGHAQSFCDVDRQELIRHVYTLASDSLAGRMTGEPGQKKAADYIASHFGEIGLTPFITDTGYFQLFTLYVTEHATVTFGGVRTEVPVTAFSSGHQELTDSCVFLYGHKRVSTDHERLAEDHAFLLLNPKNLRQARRKVRNHYKSGVRRFVVVADGPYWTFHLMRHSMPHMKLHMIPEVAATPLDKIISGLDSVLVALVTPVEMARVIGFSPDFELLSQESARHGAMVQLGSRMVFGHVPSAVNEVVTENVVGMIKGTRDLDEVVVITAHYDHVGVDQKGVNVGADDNASGTAALIELARIMQCRQDSGVVYDRSILFVAFSAEEVGLLGSAYFVGSDDFARVKPLVNLNMDMIGRSVRYGMWQALMLQAGGGGQKEDISQREAYVYLTNRGKGTRNYVKYARQSAAALDEEFMVDRSPGLATRLTFRESSDHASFLGKGIPAMVWFTGLHPDYHTPHDTPDKIDYDNMVRITRVLFGTTEAIVNQ